MKANESATAPAPLGAGLPLPPATAPVGRGSHDPAPAPGPSPPEGLLDAAIQNTARSLSIRNTAAEFLGVAPDKLFKLLRVVWKPSKDQPELTDQELFSGISLIARYGLDPITKEVYVTRGTKGLMTIIGIDGFIKILDRTEGYDGFDQELFWNPVTRELEWVETRIYSTRRSRPTVYRAFATEYSKISGLVAKQIPWHMLRLFSLRHATRLFTPIGGTAMILAWLWAGWIFLRQ